MRRLGVVLSIAAASFALACGDGTRCRDASDCPATPAAVAQQAEASPEPSATAAGSTPTPEAATTAGPTAVISSDTYYSSPTPVPPPPTAIPPSPTVTATLTPPLPGTFPTRPPDPPFTPDPGPVIPVASDMRIGPSGKYYASVDGCRWDEFRRETSPSTGAVIEVGLTTPCLPYEAIIFHPSTGEIDHLIS